MSKKQNSKGRKHSGPQRDWRANIPSLLSPEPWVKRSWYCLLGKFAGKNLFIMGLKREVQRRAVRRKPRRMRCPAPLRDGAAPQTSAHTPPPRDREMPGFATSGTGRSPGFSHQAADTGPCSPQRSDLPVCDSPPKFSSATGTEHHPQEVRTHPRPQQVLWPPQQPPGTVRVSSHPELAVPPLNGPPAEQGAGAKALPQCQPGESIWSPTP